MADALQQHFRMLALYNRWANNQLDESAALLSDAELRQDRHGYFGSVLGVLNHLLVTDRMWMKRLEGKSPRATRLDEILYQDFQALRQARARQNQEIKDYVYALSEQALLTSLSYETTSGVPQSQPCSHILAHLFNHQTHHRGQAHDLIGQLIGQKKTPVLDLLAYQRFVMPNDEP